jgi:hypothetical protein
MIMKKLIVRPKLFSILLLLVFMSLSVESAAQRGNRSQPPAFRITAIQAKLFFDHRGTFSEDVLSGENKFLWNVAISGGSMGSLSTSTLVLVEVSGKPGDYGPGRKIEFIARGPRSLLLRKITEVGILGDEGKFYAGFWLYDTGCDPIRLSARIVGQSPALTMKKTIDFHCGE